MHNHLTIEKYIGLNNTLLPFVTFINQSQENNDSQLKNSNHISLKKFKVSQKMDNPI